MRRREFITFLGAVAVTWPVAARAQRSGTILVTLGTAGGPVPRPDRMQSSNLLVVNGTLYLIDAGGGVTHRVVQAGYDYRQVSKVFITHAHSDHMAGLATLLVSAWEQQAPPIDIYGSGVEAVVKGAIDYMTPNAEIRWAEGKKRPMADTFRARDVAPGVVYQDGNVKVTAVENTHFHFQPGDPAYGKYKSSPNALSRCPLLRVRRTHIDITGVFDFAAWLPPPLPPGRIGSPPPLSRGVTDAPGDDIPGTARRN